MLVQDDCQLLALSISKHILLRSQEQHGKITEQS